MQHENFEIQSGRILRLPEVKKLTGLSRSTLYMRMREKRFPDQVDLGGRAVGWRAEAVQQWINSLTAKNNK